MTSIKKFTLELEYYLDGMEYHQSGNELEVFSEDINLSVKLNKKALKSLCNQEIINSIEEFKYYNHYGFSFNDYGEFFIGNDSISLYELYGNNTFIDLNFKIGDSHIEVSSVSSLCRLLLEPYYSKDLGNVAIADRGLQEFFFTIKIFDTPTTQHKEFLIKAIYYLNSHYMHKTGSFVGVYQMLPDLINDIDSDTVYVERTRTRTRKDFISIEPIIFFNYASTQSRENYFLGFYRILEFFFYRALENELKKQRFDPGVSEKSIIQAIQKKDERSLLAQLLKNTLTNAQKQKFVLFLFNKSLISKRSFEHFSEKLYDYRNSLVHAKEYQIDTTQIPDLFNERNEHNGWNYVIREIAKICISKLNTKQ